MSVADSKAVISLADKDLASSLVQLIESSRMKEKNSSLTEKVTMLERSEQDYKERCSTLEEENTAHMLKINSQIQELQKLLKLNASLEKKVAVMSLKLKRKSSLIDYFERQGCSEDVVNFLVPEMKKVIREVRKKDPDELSSVSINKKRKKSSSTCTGKKRHRPSLPSISSMLSF